MEQKITPTWMKGLVIGLIIIVFSLILYFTGQALNRSLSWISFCIIIGGLIWACNDYAKQMNGNVTFGNVFSYGFKTTAAIAVFVIIYTVVSLNFIYPELIDKTMEQARQEMQKKGNLTDEQVQQGITMARKFFFPFAIGGIIIMYAIVGAIGSLIGAAIAKKNPNPTIE
ncbi:MAG: hypothetical protein NVSMB63_15570 [Sediminibacterium sp.]